MSISHHSDGLGSILFRVITQTAAWSLFKSVLGRCLKDFWGPGKGLGHHVNFVVMDLGTLLCSEEGECVIFVEGP